MYTLKNYEGDKNKFTSFRKISIINWLTSKAKKKRTCHSCGLKIKKAETHLAVYSSLGSLPWVAWRQNICLFCLEDIIKFCKKNTKGIKQRRTERLAEKILINL